MQSSKNSTNTYDILIIGGGASGTSLLYTLGKYSNIGRIGLLEKYSGVGLVNSNGTNNSQSLHIGDIEMHYSREKAASVKPGALMIPTYLDNLTKEASAKVMTRIQKMALAVGESEVADMKKRYKEFDGLFPDQKMLTREEIEEVEPQIIKGRDESESVLALYNENGHAVDYEELSKSFISEAVKFNSQNESAGRVVKTHLDTKVEKIIHNHKTDQAAKYAYTIETSNGIFHAHTVVVNTDSYSLLFAKSLGYGKKYSLVPVGASFYYTPEVLKGKVYPMQDKRLPFAGVHGDPDLRKGDVTRWGPTATFYPVLESGHWNTTWDYFRSAGLGRFKAIRSFLKVMLDGVRVRYFAKSMMYDLPLVGKYLFLKNVKKIVPSITVRELKKAKGVGGMRLQRINIETGELEMGEGKIIGDNIIFNMTPSPGASVCLFNAMRDAKHVVDFFNDESNYCFDENRMKEDLKFGETEF